jgi:hypothetical protein
MLFRAITGTTPASICGAGTVTLAATASAGTINWYDALTGGTSGWYRNILYNTKYWFNYNLLFRSNERRMYFFSKDCSNCYC